MFGIVERNGDVLTRHVQMRTKAHIIPHVVTYVKPGTKIYTDEGSAFRLLTEKYGYDHQAVDHSAKEYVRGDVHTNTIEGFWANVKRGTTGLTFGFRRNTCRLTFASSSIAITCASRPI